ncbi:MAG: hypothetical protein WCV68_03675 [Candidatus Paceibacterota bacterium]|jgi:hypothetical protein
MKKLRDFAEIFLGLAFVLVLVVVILVTMPFTAEEEDVVAL